MRKALLLVAVPLSMIPAVASAQKAEPLPWNPSPRAAADPTLPGADAPAQPPPPTSTSGTSLAPLMPQTAAPAPVTGTPAVETAHDAELDARVRALEMRMGKNEEVDKEQSASMQWLRKFRVSGYVQPQFLLQINNAAASPNSSNGSLPPGISANDIITKSDGTSTNRTYFRLRRARLKTEFSPTDYARLVFEIDPNLSGGPSGGTGTIARQVEAVGIAHLSKDTTVEFAAGMFKVPFDREILQSDADRPFIERSWGEQNLFPGEYDMGARAAATARGGKLTGQLAVVNGQTIGEKNFAVLPDLNRSKDFVGRINYDFGPFDVGLGLYFGRGQLTDTTLLRFKQFGRGAGQLEAAVHHRIFKKLGDTRAFGEILIGRNMDRGLNYGPGIGLPTIPTSIGDDIDSKDERSVFIRLEQDVSQWFTFAARYDFYSPDTAQANNARDTYGFVWAVHFTKGLKLMLEFDHAIDNVHAAGKEAPSKQIESVSGVLQARF